MGFTMPYEEWARRIEESATEKVGAGGTASAVNPLPNPAVHTDAAR